MLFRRCLKVVCYEFQPLSKKSVEKNWGKKREYAVIEVVDSGIGIEKEMLNNIFNPFFTTKTGGTGLGLMVVQGIIRDHEGWVEVESEVGQGSIFRVYLPKADDVLAGQGEKGEF